MLQEWNREFADAEIPVRMSRPLDVQFIPEVKIEMNILAVQLVGDRAIVNALDRAVWSDQFSPLLTDIPDIDDADPELLRCNQKVRQRFLLIRINLDQRDFVRSPVAQNRAAE